LWGGANNDIGANTLVSKNKSFDFTVMLVRNNNGVEQYIENCTMTYLAFTPTKDY
jgi:hypothetical protein